MWVAQLLPLLRDHHAWLPGRRSSGSAAITVRADLLSPRRADIIEALFRAAAKWNDLLADHQRRIGLMAWHLAGAQITLQTVASYITPGRTAFSTFGLCLLGLPSVARSWCDSPSRS